MGNKMEISLMNLGQIPTEMAAQPNAVVALNLDVVNLLGTGEAISTDWIASLEQFLTPDGAQTATTDTPALTDIFGEVVESADSESPDSFNIDWSSLLASVAVPSAFGHPVSMVAPDVVAPQKSTEVALSPIPGAGPFHAVPKEVIPGTTQITTRGDAAAPVLQAAVLPEQNPPDSVVATPEPSLAPPSTGLQPEPAVDTKFASQSEPTKPTTEAAKANLDVSSNPAVQSVVPQPAAAPEATRDAQTNKPSKEPTKIDVANSVPAAAPAQSNRTEVKAVKAQLDALGVAKIDWNSQPAPTPTQTPATAPEALETESPVQAVETANPSATPELPTKTESTAAQLLPDQIPADAVAVETPTVSTARVNKVPIAQDLFSAELAPAEFAPEAFQLTPTNQLPTETETAQKHVSFAMPTPQPVTREPVAEAEHAVVQTKTVPVTTKPTEFTGTDKPETKIENKGKVSPLLQPEKAEIKAELDQAQGTQEPAVTQQKFSESAASELDTLIVEAKPMVEEPTEIAEPSQATTTTAPPAPAAEAQQIQTARIAPSAEPKTTKIDTENLMRQVIDRVETIAQYGKSGSVTIHLDPKELGPLTLTVRSFGQRVDAEIQTQNSDVRAALHDSRQQLNQAVEARGLSLGSMQISHQDQGRGQQQETLRQQDFEQFQNMRQAMQQEQPKPTISGRILTTTTGVDLTV